MRLWRIATQSWAARHSVELPREVSLSDPGFEAQFTRVTYTAASGQTFRGGLVYYTATVVQAAANSAAGAAFVAYLPSPELPTVLQHAGFELAPAKLYGNPAEVPATLQAAATA